MKAKQKSTGSFTPVPVGAHMGVCTGLFDIGIQPGGKFDPKHQLIISWTLPNQLNDEGKPMTISGTYTSSMNKKSNLRKVIESWFGKSFPSEDAAGAFDFNALLGRACMVNVIHKESGEKTYANVTTVMPVPGGVPKPEVTGEPQYYSPDDQDPGSLRAAYAALPEWIRKKVDQQLPPDQGPESEAVGATVGDDDIPF
jgi:hypothetical protein